MLQRLLLISLTLNLLTACASTGPEITPTPQGEAQQPITTTPAAPTPTPEPVQPSPTPEPVEPTPTQPQTPGYRLAFTGADGNLWLLERARGELRQVTQDAIPFKPGEESATISYCCAAFSSDDQFLAYQRETGAPHEHGYTYVSELWIYDVTTGETRLALDDLQGFGFSWKPGAYLLAYALQIPFEYFLSTPPDTSGVLATGIWAFNIETGENSELAPPERGYALVNPRWSADGRFLGFDEVLGMEGRGQFAYYDFSVQEYLAWDEVIGGYDWSPDGELIAYDRLAYTATGDESIWLRNRNGEGERALSPEYEPGYAINPVFSPQGDQLAYLAELSGPESPLYSLFVIPLAGGEPRLLGQFEQVMALAWTPDGEYLIFSAGPYEAQQVIEVSVAQGAASVLAAGAQPALAGP